MGQQLTKEQQKQEFIKCAQDVVYFLETYGKVKHPVRGLVPFKMYEFQKDCLINFESNRFNIILKGRQLGLSTLVAGYVSWLMIFQPNKEILIVAIKQAVAINLIKKIKIFMQNLPDLVRPTLVSDNIQSASLGNGSNCTASTSSDEAGRSEALSLLILDEAAFIKNIDDLWTAASPTLATGGNAIVLSTPSGQGNWFHKTFQDAESGLNNFVPMVLPWHFHPDRDDKWYDDTLKQLNYDKQRMAQEHECDFIASGNTVISGEALSYYKNKMVGHPLSKSGPSDSIWQWAKPKKDYSYMVVADTARGDGTDYSTYIVMDLKNFSIVEEFKFQVSVADFASLLIRAGTTYNKALLVIENNGLGWSTVTEVVNRGYDNLYYSDKNSMKRNPYVANVPDHKKVVGFAISPISRPLIIDSLVEAVNSMEFGFHSKRMFDELSVFIWQYGKAQAMRGYNDDLVIPLAIGCYLRAEGLRETGRMGADSYTTMGRTFAEVLAPSIDPEHSDDPWVDDDCGDLRWLIDISKG
tara:strand:- start:5140 stop:6711 length:1572 start_codon:yes stop_codon:yes gene_type:complete